MLEEEQGVEARKDLLAGLVDGADDAPPRPRQALEEPHHEERGAGAEPCCICWWCVSGCFVCGLLCGFLGVGVGGGGFGRVRFVSLFWGWVLVLVVVGGLAGEQTNTRAHSSILCLFPLFFWAPRTPTSAASTQHKKPKKQPP